MSLIGRRGLTKLNKTPRENLRDRSKFGAYLS